MKGYIKVSDILKYCEEAVATHEELIQKALDKNGPMSNVSAAAFFMQQQRIYKYDIPGMVAELGGSEDSILNDNILNLELPTATYNILTRNNITTVGELSDKTIRELKKMRGLGVKSLEYLLHVLENNGIKLKH